MDSKRFHSGGDIYAKDLQAMWDRIERQFRSMSVSPPLQMSYSPNAGCAISLDMNQVVAQSNQDYYCQIICSTNTANLYDAILVTSVPNDISFAVTGEQIWAYDFQGMGLNPCNTYKCFLNGNYSSTPLMSAACALSAAGCQGLVATWSFSGNAPSVQSRRLFYAQGGWVSSVFCSLSADGTSTTDFSTY